MQAKEQKKQGKYMFKYLCFECGEKGHNYSSELSQECYFLQSRRRGCTTAPEKIRKEM